MRSARLLALAGVAVSLAATAPAGAIGTGAHTDLVGTAIVSRDISTNIGSVTAPSVASFNGQCTYARYAAGVGGSGITFTLVGEGAATGTYKGIPVVATGVSCTLYKPDMTITSGPEYLPGFASATTRSADSLDARGGRVCVEVLATLRQTPPGETDPYVSSGVQCSG